MAAAFPLMVSTMGRLLLSCDNDLYALPDSLQHFMQIARERSFRDV